MPRRFATALNALGEGGKQWPPIVHQHDRFPDGTDDVDWIPMLASEGDWIIISGDAEIGRHVHERKAWLDSGLTAFFLGSAWASQEVWTKWTLLNSWWPKITKQARYSQAGAGFIMRRNELIRLDITAAKIEIEKRIAMIAKRER
jgi:hypothetical protein